ncbi:MAG: phosphohistidine phosphatase SixA [Desulfobacterales bacterium]|jgi:phosphohistidine phosphatase|nr:phosphohistidine phosphatase SixA [Desulfobacteraceae bacterium]MBT7085841.1 phosphohistidine phosphatase SixA [Desulfobacterales bacterium]
MALLLVQHGKCLSKEEDLERSLSEEGVDDVCRIADVAEAYEVYVPRIVHSGKKRSRETAKMFAAVLTPSDGIDEIEGINPMDNVSDFAETIDPNEDLMIVGHLPFLDRLTSFLITGSVDKSVFKFQNGGIVCLIKEPENDSWVIKWALMPDIG